MAQKLLKSHNLFVLMTIVIVFGVKSSTSGNSRPTDSDVDHDLLPSENDNVETLIKLSSVENENKLIDEIASCETEICEHVNALENDKTDSPKTAKTATTTEDRLESISLDNTAVAKSKVVDNDSESNSKGVASEAKLKVANQLESLRQIASSGVVKVLKKLDDILERKEKMVLPPHDSEEGSSSTSSSESSSSSSSSSSFGSSSASSKPIPSAAADSSPFSSTSSSSFRDAEERLKLASARKLKTELESLVDDALDLVGDKLRRHLKSTTHSETASDSKTASVGTESTEEEMKQLLKKLEEKSERRKERKSADGND